MTSLREGVSEEKHTAWHFNRNANNSITKANNLTKNLSKPKNQWEHCVRLLFKLEIVMEDLRDKGYINARQEQELRDEIASLSYWTILNSPHLEENEKRKEHGT